MMNIVMRGSFCERRDALWASPIWAFLPLMAYFVAAQVFG